MTPDSELPTAPAGSHTPAAWPLAVMATFLLLITALTAQFIHVTWSAQGHSPAPVTVHAVERTALK